MSSEKGSSAVTAEVIVGDLTREIPNYIAQIGQELRSPVSDLWSLVLAVSGKMAFIPGDSATGDSPVKLGVPDEAMSGGRTRFELWRAALVVVIKILGDPEAHYRTGFDVRTLSSAVERFFATDQGPAEVAT
jgi:hypothetical protein